MSISEDLRAFILADAGITAIVGTNVSQNVIPQGTDNVPAIWFRRGTSNDELTLSSNVGNTVQFREEFDIEAVSESLDEAESLGELLKSFQSRRGSFGVGTVQAVFVDDATDFYRPVNTTGDDGRHVASVTFAIVGYEG